MKKMERLFKCRFCKLIMETRSELFKHIELAHEDNIIEEVFYDK